MPTPHIERRYDTVQIFIETNFFTEPAGLLHNLVRSEGANSMQLLAEEVIE